LADSSALAGANRSVNDRSRKSRAIHQERSLTKLARGCTWRSQWRGGLKTCLFDVVRSTALITLDCGPDGMDRYFTLHYVNDDVTVGSLFLIDIQGRSRQICVTFY